MTLRIGAVILAAGASARMGRQKLLLPLGDKPVLAHVLSAAAGMRWQDCIAVIGEPETELAALCGAHGIRWVFNPNRLTGQASSVALGVGSLDPGLDGIIFLQGDQPLVSAALLQAITEKFLASGSRKTIVAPRHEGEYCSPALFGADWRPCLASLTGDRGGRGLIRQNPEQVVAVDWPEGRDFCDADTWEEYQALLLKLDNKTGQGGSIKWEK